MHVFVLGYAFHEFLIFAVTQQTKPFDKAKDEVTH